MEDRRSRATILRVVGHVTCLYGFTQLWFEVGIRHWHSTGEPAWGNIAWGSAAFAIGLFQLRTARDFRRRSAPLPAAKP